MNTGSAGGGVLIMSPAELVLIEVALLSAFAALGYWLGRRRK